MATDALVDSWAAQQNRIAQAAISELNSFWAALDKSRPDTRELMTLFMRDLVSTYGDVAAGVAADWFDEVREASVSARGSYRAVASGQIPSGQVFANTGWALSTVDRLGNLAGVVDRLVKQAGRDTVAENTRRSKARYARVPRGKTCAFCLMTASRGPVYRSAKTAGEGNAYHAFCDCVPTPVWDSSDLPESYDPEALYDIYRKGRAEAGTGNTREILTGIRTVTGHSH